MCKTTKDGYVKLSAETYEPTLKAPIKKLGALDLTKVPRLARGSGDNLYTIEELNSDSYQEKYILYVTYQSQTLCEKNQ